MKSVPQENVRRGSYFPLCTLILFLKSHHPNFRWGNQANSGLLSLQYFINIMSYAVLAVPKNLRKFLFSRAYFTGLLPGRKIELLCEFCHQFWDEGWHMRTWMCGLPITTPICFVTGSHQENGWISLCLLYISPFPLDLGADGCF